MTRILSKSMKGKIKKVSWAQGGRNRRLFGQVKFLVQEQEIIMDNCLN